MSSPNTVKNRSAYLLVDSDHSKKISIVFFSLSVVVHILFFIGVVFFQDFKRPAPLLPVIQIDLVTFSPEPATEETPKNEAPLNEAPLKEEEISIKTSPIVHEKREVPTLKPDISLKTKPKNLKDLIALQKKKKKELDKKKVKQPVEKKRVKQEIDPATVLEAAREKLKKQVSDQARDKISQALTRLQKTVKEQGKKTPGKGEGAPGGYGEKGVKPMDLYKMVLGSKIEQNWVFNETLARMDQNLEVRILIKVLKNGEIRDIMYDTKSGNRYLDESAKKAINKANPLPPLPAGMRSYDVVVIFTPKGLK
ncbi:TonB family protein [Desulfobacula sp.]|uniref:cell envelope integrity protein TolA n=1 Tax=Desulfobacula sp. TaxID=2593537 RepID=UPI00261910E6|nr:TonB family protein [Desulfobacula sp.]